MLGQGQGQMRIEELGGPPSFARRFGLVNIGGTVSRRSNCTLEQPGATARAHGKMQYSILFRRKVSSLSE